VPHGDCILSVSHSKRTVSLIRSGNKGQVSKQKHNVFNGDWDSAFDLKVGTDVPKSIGNYKSNINSRVERGNKPEFERGWSKVEKTLVTTLKISTHKIIGIPSLSTIRELGFGKKLDFNQILIGNIHDIAYECARTGGSHCISWTLQNVTTGDTLTAESEWKEGKIQFTLKFKYQ